MIGWVLFAGFWIGSIWLGGFVAKEKDREPATGYLLGLFFGLFGVLVLALLPNGQPRSSPRLKIAEPDEPEPDWSAIVVNPESPAPPPKAFTLPPPRFRGLRDDQADSL